MMLLRNADLDKIFRDIWKMGSSSYEAKAQQECFNWGTVQGHPMFCSVFSHFK